MAKKYIVDEEELHDLLVAYYILTAMEHGGVDSWEWCSESCDNFKREYYSNDPAFLAYLTTKQGHEPLCYDFEDIAEYEMLNYDEAKE